MNYRTEKQIMLFKTTVNCLFNDIWCYLVIGCFDWKIGVFQQTVVRGLLYPWKIDSNRGVFLWILPNFKKQLIGGSSKNCISPEITPQ